jgi:NADPH:quinone reductase-like Zn-dependent oxidoreductase
MRAWVISKYGEPEVLEQRELPVPKPGPGQVVVRVRAIGLNHAELYMRKGAWGEVAKVSGIESAGEVHDGGDSGLARGRRVVAIMGGMGRIINGSYAEYVSLPATNVVPIETSLAWEELVAIPEVYATAWWCLHQRLRVQRGESLLVRGGTSALGQAAINLARDAGVSVLATTRSRERFSLLEGLGAEPLLEEGAIQQEVKRRRPSGVDTTLELVGTRTLLDSLQATAPGGRLVFAGFLGGFDPIERFDPFAHLPIAAELSFFASFVFGTPLAPLDRIPLQQIVDRVQAGIYKAKPVRVFPFDRLVEAHRLMETNGAKGKLTVLGRE